MHMQLNEHLANKFKSVVGYTTNEQHEVVCCCP